MIPAANVVPLSDTGWGVVLLATVVVCVLWLVGLVVVTRRQTAGKDRGVVDPAKQKDPSTATKVSSRVVLGVVVAVAALAVVVFLVGRVGDLLA